MNGCYLTLSISKNGNVIASSWNSAKILEYTADGTFVRKIVVNRVDTNLVGLHHAIQLEGDKFLICHYGVTHHRVCIIDNKGNLIKCYGGRKGSGTGRLNRPCHLAIDWHGSILVADKDNDRIVQLNASLEYMDEFSFKRPRRLRLDKELGRLYVIENNDGTITMHDM